MDDNYDHGSSQRSFTESEQDAETSGQVYADLKRIMGELRQQLNSDADLENLSAAEKAVMEKDDERLKATQTLEAELQQLIALQSQAAASARRPPTVPTLEEHEAAVHSLEQQQVSAGKQVNEEQVRVAKKEVDLGQWRAKKEEVGGLTVGEGEEEGFNAQALRLNILDGCGFRLLPHDSATKVIVRNDGKNDINTITLDKSRSIVYWANLMWTLAGE